MYDLAMYKQIKGTATVNNGAAGPTSVLAAVTGPDGTSRTIFLTKLKISITTAAVGGGGLVNILNGTSVIQSYDANSVGNISIDFGDRGWDLTQGNAFQISVSGAVTTQATASIMAQGLVSN